MRRLPETAPSVYHNFTMGSFSIKDKPGRFTAVGGDQKLEQSINLSSKCSDGVIGHAKQKQYIAQWDLIYHEMMAVKNLHRQYSNVMANTHETYSHHQSSQATMDRNERHLHAITKFIEEKGSPLAACSSPTLHNFVTKEMMPEDIRKDMLNAVEKGKEKYLAFRRERFIEKSARISSTLHGTNLKPMKSIRTKPHKTIQTTLKAMNIAERNVEIARERGLKTDILLKYDVPSPLLFDDEGIMTKPTKSQLVQELEVHLKPEDYSYRHSNNAAFIIDVMASVRRVNISNLYKFDDLLVTFVSSSEAYRRFGHCDYVFDMYSEEPSAKDSERKRRNNMESIEYSSIIPSSPLPKDMNTFWPSNNNKLLLEKLIYNHICRNLPTSREYSVVLGQLSREEEEWQCISIHQGKEYIKSQLQSTFEEADSRIPLHVLDSLRSGHSVCVVISNDTDVLVALIYHMPVFLDHQLQELWLRAGVGDSTRYVPLHTLFDILGRQLCEVLPAVHSLTGCDISSKVGTKEAALKAEPEKLLKYFGRLSNVSSPVLKNAETYLVKVLKSTTHATNFLELRAEMFHHAKGRSHNNLPPTTQGLTPHIKRMS